MINPTLINWNEQQMGRWFRDRWDEGIRNKQPIKRETRNVESKSIPLFFSFIVDRGKVIYLFYFLIEFKRWWFYFCCYFSLIRYKKMYLKFRETFTILRIKYTNLFYFYFNIISRGKEKKIYYFNLALFHITRRWIYFYHIFIKILLEISQVL